MKIMVVVMLMIAAAASDNDDDDDDDEDNGDDNDFLLVDLQSFHRELMQIRLLIDWIFNICDHNRLE